MEILRRHLHIPGKIDLLFIVVAKNSGRKNRQMEGERHQLLNSGLHHGNAGGLFFPETWDPTGSLPRLTLLSGLLLLIGTSKVASRTQTLCLH